MSVQHFLTSIMTKRACVSSSIYVESYFDCASYGAESYEVHVFKISSAAPQTNLAGVPVISLMLRGPADFGRHFIFPECLTL